MQLPNPRPAARLPWSFAPLLAVVLLPGGCLAGQTLIGTVSGKQVQLRGVIQIQAGQPVVSSGTEIDVAQGAARLHLQRGGEILICGPARLSVIAGGSGSLLISLEQGGINLRYASGVPDSVLTPDFRVDTVVPPGEFSSTSASLALDQTGRLCIHDQGSALTLQAMAGGNDHSLIAGDRLLFRPSDGASTPVPSCSCDPRPPAPVPETRQQEDTVGTLFPQTASLRYSPPPPSPAPAATSPAPHATAPVRTAASPKPERPRHRGFFARLFGWMHPHKHSQPAPPSATVPQKQKDSGTA